MGLNHNLKKPCLVSATSLFISLSKTASWKVMFSGSDLKGMVTLSAPRTSLTHSTKVKRRRIPDSATFSAKFASSTESPASASASLIPSAENFSMAWESVKKFPVDFDIFSEFRSKWPLARMPLGHLLGSSGLSNKSSISNLTYNLHTCLWLRNFYKLQTTLIHNTQIIKLSAPKHELKT